MKVEELLSRLDNVRRSGPGWSANCPAHKDRSPSLSVREGEDCRILVHCFAGCAPEKILAAIGSTMRDLFPETPFFHKPEVPEVRAAKRVATNGLQHLPRSIREEPVTVIFTDTEHVDAAIARALALMVNAELVQVALKENREWRSSESKNSALAGRRYCSTRTQVPA